MHKPSPHFRLATPLFLLLVSACVVSTRQQETETPKSEPAAAPAAQEPAPAAAAPEPEPAKDKPAKDKPAKAEKKKADEPKKAEAKPAPKPKPPEPIKPPPAQAAADDSKSAVAPVKPAPVKPEQSQLVVPVRVAFASAVAKIDALVDKTAKKDWTRVSKPGDSPEIEVKYTLWRSPIKARFEDQTLHVTVPVRYAATVRAKVKNPLTGKDLWITKGETWGTKAEPQEINATFHAKLAVGDDLSVKADAKLDALEHGKPPSGDVCIKAIAKICVSKASLASKVRDNIEEEITPRIKKALADADKKVAEALNLKAHAEKLWAAIQEPRSLEQVLSAACTKKSEAACKTSAWLVVKPSSLGLAGPRMDGSDLRADLAISGDFAVVLGDKPAVTPAPLPKLQPITGKEGVRIATTLRVPHELLTPDVEKALKGLKLAEKDGKPISVKGVTLVDGSDEGKPHRMTLSLGLRGALQGEIVLQGAFGYDAKTQKLTVESLSFDDKTQALVEKELPGVDLAALRKLVASKVQLNLAPALATMNKAVRGAVEQAAAGQIKITGELTQAELNDFKVGPHAVIANIVLAGQLGVAYTPK